MNLRWRRDYEGTGWLAYTDENTIVLHVGLRGPNGIEDYEEAIRKGSRYCVFGNSSYKEYCGDLPTDLSEEDLKAAAVAMWRVSS